MNGKVRSKQHIIGDTAIHILCDDILPVEWIAREMNPDYGIDLDVELFDYEDGRCITLGEHVFIQVKGLEHAIPCLITINNETIKGIKYSLEVSELNLVERMGSAIPVLLILIDIETRRAFHICLNDYIRKFLSVNKPNYRQQKTVTVYIPLSNEIRKDDINPLRWYGKRAKIYSFFHELLSDVENLDYMDIFERVKYGKALISHYSSYDILKSGEFWYGLEHLHEIFTIMSANNCIVPEAESYLKRMTDNNDNWLYETIVTDEENSVDAMLYAQDYSIKLLSEQIINYNGCFETYCRTWFMPGLPLGAK